MVELPIGVILMKLEGGFKYHGEFNVEGCKTNVETYVCCGVVEMLVRDNDVKAVDVVFKL
jgi:hypothetical protein